MLVTELYTFNLICENLLMALYGVALNNHLLSHRETLSNSVLGGSANGWTWVDIKTNLMSEPEVYGNNQFGGKYDAGVNYRQYPLFRIVPKYICNREWWSLYTVAWATGFAIVSGSGHASGSGASSALGVRPCFCIG